MNRANSIAWRASPQPCRAGRLGERYVTSFGFTLEDIFGQGTKAMEARLRAAG